MKPLSVFLWIIFGVVVGYQLKAPETIEVEVVKEAPPQPPQIQVQTIFKEVPGLCDYSAHEQTIADLQDQLDKTSHNYRDVVVPVYVPAKVITPKKKTASLTVLLSVGEGVKAVDIKTSPDGNSVYGDPKKGMVGGISAFYKFSSFSVGPVDVNGLTIGGGVIGAETKFGSIGYTWDF